MPTYMVTTDSGAKYKVVTAGEVQGKELPSNLPGFLGVAASIPKGPKAVMRQVESVGDSALNNLAGIFEGATAGIPRGIAERAGIDIPKGSPLGQIAGFIAGPGKVASAATKAVKGAGIAKGALKGILGGAVGGALTPQDDPFDLGERAAKGAGGAVLGAGIGSIGGAIGRLSQIKDKNLIKSLDSFQTRVEKTRIDAGKAFGKSVDDIAKLPKNANKSVDILDEVDDFTNFALSDDKLLKFANKVPGLKRLLDNPDAARNLSNRHVQELSNEINQGLRKAARDIGSTKSFERKILGFIESIKLKQSSVFPEMNAVRETFARKAEAFKFLRRAVKGNALENAIVKNFGGARGRKAVIDLLGEDGLKEVTKLGNTLRVGRFFTQSVPRSASTGVSSAAGAGAAITLIDKLRGG